MCYTGFIVKKAQGAITSRPFSFPSHPFLFQKNEISAAHPTPWCPRGAPLSAKCHELGFYVSKPWSDDCPYDFIIDKGDKGDKGDKRKRLIRVQVKSTSSVASKTGAYACAIRRKKSFAAMRSYRASEVDLIAVYIAPEKCWLILPVRELLRNTTFYFKPRDPASRYARFVEAWHLLE